VTVYEDGKVIDNFTLPEGGNYTWETSDYGIDIMHFIFVRLHMLLCKWFYQSRMCPDAPLSHFIQVTIHWEVFFM